MPIVDYQTTVNVPGICRSPETILDTFNGNQRAILDSRFIANDFEFNTYYINNCKIEVSKKFHDIDEQWLKTQLGSNISCYIPTHGGLSWLPLTLPQKWIVQDKSKPKPTSIDDIDKFAYVEVLYTDESCLGELCCNAYKYTFDITSGVFIRHNNPNWNAIKAVLRKYILPLTGGTEDRLADYGRIIMFLLSKVNLTESEKEVFSELLEFSPTAVDLQKIIKREALIQKFVLEAKNNPTGFLLWGEDWNHYWWETSNV